MIDQARFETVSLGNQEFANEIVQRFLSDVTLYKHIIRRGIENRDFISIKKVFQQLKSACQVFGVTILVDKIWKIEMAGLDQYDLFEEMIKDSFDLVLDLEAEAKAMVK